jgi:hypothetical protein
MEDNAFSLFSLLENGHLEFVCNKYIDVLNFLVF